MASLDTVFSALSDPTRRAILTQLTQGEATVLQLAEPFAMSQPAISRHIKVLEEAGLIMRRVDGSKRPCRLSKAGVDAIDQWLETLRGAMERNYQCLDQVLEDMKMEMNNEQIDS